MRGEKGLPSNQSTFQRLRLGGICAPPHRARPPICRLPASSSSRVLSARDGTPLFRCAFPGRHLRMVLYRTGDGMIEARIKQGRLSFAESEYLLASLNGLADGAPNPLISKMHDMAVVKGEFRPYSVVWWDEKCDRIVFDLEAANLVRHKRGARHLKPATDSPYDCYRIVSPCLSAEQLEHAREILDCLDPRIRFKSDKLTDDPGFLLDNEEPLRALSSWLARRAESASEVSTRERCYEIWDDEKAFDEGGMRRLLKAISFDFSLLKVHDSENEEYSRYITPDEGFVIISENQDMWHSMRCLIEKGSLSMDGCRIRGGCFRKRQDDRGRWLQKNHQVLIKPEHSNRGCQIHRRYRPRGDCDSTGRRGWRWDSAMGLHVSAHGSASSPAACRGPWHEAASRPVEEGVDRPLPM